MADVIDAVVIGSGPNGLSAAIVLAQAGLRVAVYEAAPAFGGAARSEQLTLPGFINDVGSAVHPFAVASPFFRSLPLRQYGLEWLEPAVQVAHPLHDGTAVAVYRSLERTAGALGRDAPGYQRIIGWTVANWPRLEEAVLAPFHIPRHPFTLAAFGLTALDSIAHVGRRVFRAERGLALLAGIAGHGMLPLDVRPSAGVALTLGALAHLVGWVVPRGGAQQISNALAAHLNRLGGDVHVNARIASLDEIPSSARLVMCDLSPRPFLRIAGHRLPQWYRDKLQRYRYGMGVFKVDWALDGPIPWIAPECRQSCTVHVGGTFDEIARSELDAWEGRVAPRPFVIVTQPSVVDDTRAPHGGHAVWGYCHVPNASTADMLPAIEAQIERFAPGFARRIMGRHVMTPADLEAMNANLVGGDIAAGAPDLTQFFTRPTWRTYSTPVKGLYLCSASTPPGVGVHGMCGFHAARRALRDLGMGHT